MGTALTRAEAAPDVRAGAPAPAFQRKPGRRRPGFFVFACLLAAGAAPASAQVMATGEYLERMDADGDGRVSLVEYQDWMSYAFDAMDRDGDGVLTASELPGGRGRPVHRTEHRARLARTFNRQDIDRNGSLDARELAAPPQ